MDDLITGGTTVSETQVQKEKTIEVFNDAVFTIHKCHSNAPELEPKNEPQPEPTDLTYAKGTSFSRGFLFSTPHDVICDQLQ